MARPRQGEVRDQLVNFRLTLEETLRLRERAARAGRSVSDYARAAALGARLDPAARVRPPFALEPASFHQIRLLGVNLNQIARRLNAQDMPAPPELAPLLAEIHAVLRKASTAMIPNIETGNVVPRRAALLPARQARERASSCAFPTSACRGRRRATPRMTPPRRPSPR